VLFVVKKELAPLPLAREILLKEPGGEVSLATVRQQDDNPFAAEFLPLADFQGGIESGA
jgi:hypothetical protein